MIIDTHTHAVPELFISYVEKNPGCFAGSTVTLDDKQKRMLSFEGKRPLELFEGLYNVKKRLSDMDARRIDVDWISVPPFVLYYGLPPAEGLQASMLLNDGLAQMASEAPDRFRVLANVPMQDVDAACKELERVVSKYGFIGVQLGTSVEGKYYDEPEFLPFFQLCEKLNLVILFHPSNLNLKGPVSPLQKYYLTNYIGNPLETTICLARMAFGGVMMKCPKLKLIFVHGGGYVPYQRMRFEHGHSRRQEGRVVIGDAPLAPFFDQVYYDIITHGDDSLRFLISSHGSKKIVLGSDYPFDMAEDHPVERVEGIGLSSQEQDDILFKTAQRLLEVR